MGFFVISPRGETTWAAAPRDVDAWVRRTWPEAVSQIWASEVRSIVWEWPDHSQAYIETAGQAVYIEASAHTIAEFAFAFAAQFANGQPLVLYDESYTVVIPLTGTTEDTIRDALDAPT